MIGLLESTLPESDARRPTDLSGIKNILLKNIFKL